jgi:hypothetical protein
MKRVGALLAVLLVAVLLAAPSVRAATYPPGGPDDPGYAPVERGFPQSCLTETANDEEHYLYSFEPKCTPNAHDPDGAAGMSVNKAWSTYTTGDPHIVIAYIEGGINWHDPGARDLANQVYINPGELPPPEDAQGHTHPDAPLGGYDLDGDPVVDVGDYAHDPRVTDANHNGYIDPEDLIAAFSSWCNKGGTWHRDPVGCAGYDSDHDGYPHDISGWDVYDNQNDPATYDSTYDHSDDQMLQAAAQGNNGFGGVGLCPGCRILPVKAGAEALDRTDDLAQAWLYACRSGANVIVSVTADLGYSSFMNQVINYCWSKNVVMVEASNDFDSIDHQGGMFHPFVIPGNGEVDNTYGYDMVNPGGLAAEAVNQATTDYTTRSDETSWGTHAMFSAATDGGSTSESTPTVGGAFALLLSWGYEAAQGGLIHGALTNDEAIQVMRATADPITSPTLGWPGSPGDWNLQYGYGRPDLYRAMQAVAADDIPPVAWFTGPDWYSLYDPTSTGSVPVSGYLAAPRSGPYRWTLEYGLGPQPTSWTTFASGAGTAPRNGVLGNLDLSQIPQSFWSAGFGLSTTKELPTNDQYTVTLRLRVYDASGRMGEDRRAIAVHHDPSLLPGFPLRVGVDGTSEPALVDLQATGRLDMVFGDADGHVHAIDPSTGRELPGWPVSTLPVSVESAFPGIDPGHEPVIAPVAVGDLFHDGRLEVVATSTTGRTYVWSAAGLLLPGWPRSVGADAVVPPIPRPALDYTRLAHMGATASPVLISLTGGAQLDIVQASWDGQVYAWTPSGAAVPGWPVHVTPGGLHPPSGMVMIDDQKLDLTPAVADLDGDGPDIVVQSQYDFTPGSGIQFVGSGHVFAFHANGTPVAGWPVQVPALVIFYDSAQEFLTEGSTAPVAAPVLGDGTDQVAVSDGILGPTFLLGGDGSTKAVYNLAPNPLAEVQEGTVDPDVLQNLPADAPVTFTTSGAFGRIGGSSLLDYAEPASGGASVAAALLLNGSGTAIRNFSTGQVALGGAPIPGMPQLSQGLDFLGEPVIADVTGNGEASVITGGDSSSLQAASPSGQAPGFPKWTTGWTVFSPSVGDLFGTGHNDVVATTREGYLMAWATPGLASANDEWWTYQHDEHRTGLYGVDTRPPGTLRSVSWKPGSTLATFVAPGDNWYDGTVAGYRVSVDGASSVVGPSGPAGSTMRLSIPAGARTVIVQAFDKAGNLGPAVNLAVAAVSGPVAPGTAGLTGGVLPVLPVTGGSTWWAPFVMAGALGLLVVWRGRRRGRPGAGWTLRRGSAPPAPAPRRRRASGPGRGTSRST